VCFEGRESACLRMFFLCFRQVKRFRVAFKCSEGCFWDGVRFCTSLYYFVKFGMSPGREHNNFWWDISLCLSYTVCPISFRCAVSRRCGKKYGSLPTRKFSETNILWHESPPTKKRVSDVEVPRRRNFRVQNFWVIKKFGRGSSPWRKFFENSGQASSRTRKFSDEEVLGQGSSLTCLFFDN